MPASASDAALYAWTVFRKALRLTLSTLGGRPLPRLTVTGAGSSSGVCPLLLNGFGRVGRGDGSALNAPSISSYMSISSATARLADELFVPAERLGGGRGVLLTAAFASWSDAMRLGVSIFLRFEERGASSMVQGQRFNYHAAVGVVFCLDRGTY